MEKVDHIGIAVKSIDEAMVFYTETLGFRCTAIEEVKTQQVRVAFIDANNVKIELLESLDEKGPISKFIEKRGEGIHHIAIGVQSIEERISELKEKGIRMVDDVPKEGAGQSLVAFLHPKSGHGVLYELCEKTHMEEK
ncbi:methylmalonyl-CoA epimerase [Siminovitchia fortis]|uniref:Methylmalonyl-CoA epimerase n=1 Tax=Siminovitchia fortis TaxID=254758 RepID=A0A443J421_9BACI|nr:methylmalonyl-CoA epimerase [Siminovitchia fortis]RWR15063.1 methylmalonyl-CoA epimerase [Siminovitchia fortis]WHY82800.1 methylmalonyl-CoA epimerase [Siminovitchia fortis]